MRKQDQNSALRLRQNSVSTTMTGGDSMLGDGGDSIQHPATPLLLSETSSNSEDPLQQQNHQSRSFSSWRRAVAFLKSHSALMDEHGSNGKGVVLGLSCLILVGVLLGISLPKNPSLPTVWYRTVSSVIGYTYFVAWSVSFYPQVWSNWKRRSTRGLSPDFCGLNVIGFSCYTIYNVTFFWNKHIQDLYRERHGASAELTVQSNDVAFAVHAWLLSSVTFAQIGYLDGMRAWRPSKLIGWIMAGMLGSCLLLACLIGLDVGPWNWLDYLYWLSFVKVGVTLIKYIPQAYLNFRRKSTSGWSIWNILLDFTGGVLSTLQLVLDCADLGDFSGITGNLAKFGLGNVSIVFDLLFMTQHYLLYDRNGNSLEYMGAPLSFHDEKTDAAVV